jgi:Tol biopolymer transport system component
VHGSWQVRKVPIAGGEETVVEDGPVQLWAISPDGKMVAFSFVDEQKKNTRIAVRRLDASEPFKYFDISPGISLQWTRDGRALSYVQPISGSANIWLQPLDGKPPRPLTALSADEWIATYAWSLDGKTLAYTRINTTFDAALMELK